MSNCVCRGKDSANRTEYETKMDFFVSIPEVPPIFAAQRQSSARRVKSRTNNKVFVFFSEPPPIFGGAKVVKGERNVKRIEDFFAFPNRILSSPRSGKVVQGE